MDNFYNNSINSLLTRKVEEVTGTQMKQIEVQKMEDDYTIKMLERQYLETKRNLAYTKKKLQEARNEAAEQTETMNQLLQANKAIVEKFNELKQYQTGSLLVSLNNADKMYFNWKDKYTELSNQLHIIIDKENYSYKLNEGISNKKNELTAEIKKQIGQRGKVMSERNEELIQFNKNIEVLQMQLNQEASDNGLKNTIEQKKKAISSMEVDHQNYQQQSKQETDNLLQMKNNQVQEFQKNNKSFKQKKESVSKLQLELSSIAMVQSKLNEALFNAKSEKEMILPEITKGRQINDTTKKAFDENVTNIKNEQEKINADLETTEKNFKINEEKLQQEFGMLRAALEEKKKLIKKLESSEENLKQLKTMKSIKLKESDVNSKEKQDEVTDLNSYNAKLRQALSECGKKEIDLNAKIKELQEFINSKQKELNSIENEENNTLPNTRKEKAKSILQKENKAFDLTDKLGADLNRENKKKENWFDSDDSEESEDEFKIQNEKPKKSNSATASQKKPIYDRDWDTESIDRNSDNRSQSDKLFNELLSQKPVAVSNNKDVFKVPQAHMTPSRKKTYTPARKY